MNQYMGIKSIKSQKVVLVPRARAFRPILLFGPAAYARTANDYTEIGTDYWHHTQLSALLRWLKLCARCNDGLISESDVNLR